jgi:hypothetical protein
MTLMKKAITISIICGLCIIFCLPLFVHPDIDGNIGIKDVLSNWDNIGITNVIDNWGRSDWDIHLFWLEAPVITIKEYGQLPLWNPWDGGGMVLHQHHEVHFLTPFTFLYFLFPSPHAIKISILLHYVIALTGMYILGRKIFGINNFLLILIPSSIFVFNSLLSLHIAEGHTWILPVAYIPYVYFFFEKYVSGKSKINLILCSLFICIMIFEGGTYPVPLMILSLIIYSLSMFVLRINRDYFPALIEVGLFTILLSAIKTIPLLDYMWEHQRLISTTEIIPLNALFSIFLMRNQILGVGRSGFEGQKYLWHEYGCYIGIGLLIFILIAMITNIRFMKNNRYGIPWFICFAMLSLLFLGDFHRFAPYTMLKTFPLFSSTRVTGRFLIMMTFIASLLSFPLSVRIEHALNKFRKKTTRNLFAVAIVIFSCTILLDLFYVNAKTFGEAFRLSPHNIEYYSDEFSSKHEYKFINSFPSYGAYSAQYPALRMNIGTNCALKANPPKKGFDPTNPLVFSTNNGTKISNSIFTPNKIYFNVETPVRSKIILNQNYVRGWKFSLPGLSVKNESNRPAIEIEKGTYKNVYFYFLPDSIIIGLLLTSIGIIVSIIVIKFNLKLIL